MYIHGLRQCLYQQAREVFEWRKWKFTGFWCSLGILPGLLGSHRLVAESKQVKWFPHQPQLIRQQWLTFIRNNIFLNLMENSCYSRIYQSLRLISCFPEPSWEKKRREGEIEKNRLNLEDRPIGFFSFLVF